MAYHDVFAFAEMGCVWPALDISGLRDASLTPLLYKTFKHIKTFRTTLKGKLKYPVVLHEISQSNCPGVRQFNSLHMIKKTTNVCLELIRKFSYYVFYVITLLVVHLIKNSFKSLIRILKAELKRF